MPQLVKGGKHAYAWSKVNTNGRIVIPNDATTEYNLLAYDKVILMSGSKRSGGFGVTSVETLKKSAIHVILEGHPQLAEFQTNEGGIVEIKGRNYCWVKMNKNGSITVPLETLEKYGVTPGDKLLSVRGSCVALGFIVKGPIIDEAKKHSNIKMYE